MNIAISTLNIMIHMRQLPSLCILTSNPSNWDEINSAKSFIMVQVPGDLGTMNGCYYNLRTVTTSLRLFILVLISSLYLIITVEMKRRQVECNKY